jgi:hypothetical protein
MSTSLGLSPESAPGTGNLRASVLVITLTDDDGRLRIPHVDGAAIRRLIRPRAQPAASHPRSAAGEPVGRGVADIAARLGGPTAASTG